MARSSRVAGALLLAGFLVAAVAAPVAGAPPASYAVTLAAEPTALGVGEYSTLTVTANQDLSTTRYTTYLFDRTDPTWYRACKARSCAFQVTQFTPGTHSYIAYVARDRNPPRYPPMQVQATSGAVAVTWSASTYTVTLSADRTWLAPGATATLTAEANKAVDGSAFAIQVYDVAQGVRIALCTSGATCSVDVSEVSPTTRSYQAFVGAPGTSPPPPHVQASSNVVSVTWSVLPDPSRPPNAGAGPIAGTVVFEGDGVPPIDADCAPTRFAFEGTSVSAWVNGSGTAYAGPVVITATGGSACENAETGTGAITVSAVGASPLGTLSCGTLTGTVARTSSDVLVVVRGDCTVNDFPAFRVGFIAKGEFLSTNLGGGVTAPVTEAAFVGAFVIVPD